MVTAEGDARSGIICPASARETRQLSGASPQVCTDHQGADPQKSVARPSMLRLPAPRGVLSEFVFDHLRRPPQRLPDPAWPPVEGADDEDLQLALYCLYELHYRGFEGVSDEWEWHASLLAFRSILEAEFLDRVIALVGPPNPVRDVEDDLNTLVHAGDGPSLSKYMAERGTLREFREFAIHRSAYQLKEADPHSWVIPRLHGEPKAALIEIQADEYGGGRFEDMHATLFGVTMRCLGLDSSYGCYLDEIPAVTLATVNLISFFGLHRRWRGALVGHLAVFEMSSVVPNSRYSLALHRLGVDPRAADFYDVHVEADAVHEVIACQRLAGGFAALEPERAGDVLFGARSIMALEQAFTLHLLDSWSDGRTSLYRPHDKLSVLTGGRALSVEDARRSA
ncbi:MAG: hypothetical protein QOF30_416 [Acidimicrobiaceae bacterium]|nr:hypothetical protein [Acidimicrobiaceae bacterium]